MWMHRRRTAGPPVDGRRGPPPRGAPAAVAGCGDGAHRGPPLRWHALCSFSGDSLSAGVYLIDVNANLGVNSSTPEDSFDLDWTLTLTTVPTPGAIAMLVPGLLGMAAGSRRRRS